jgi:hypothetical protein
MPRRLLLALCACSLIVPAVAACGGDGGTAGASPTGTSAPGAAGSSNSSGSSLKLDGPASKYSVAITDLGVNWITDIPATYVLNIDNYAPTRSFSSAEEGRRLLTEWGYQSGYETGYSPEGRDTAVLNGAFYVRVESHLFAAEAGAKAAMAYFESIIKSTGASPVSTGTVGNESAAFTATFGTIGKSKVNAVYHHVIFRRGNLVTVVLTKGAEGFMKVDPAREIALIADQKALGQKPAVEPTPTSNYTPAAGN